MLKNPLTFFLALSGLITLGSCAPTSGSIEGTSETTENTTQASSDLSSSTSPDGDDEEEEERQAKVDREAAVRFASANMHRLRQDAMEGGGEYLESVGLLLGVREERLEDYGRIVQRNFSSIFSRGSDNAQRVVAHLEREIERRPELLGR